MQSGNKHNILTVLLEDYFHVEAFNRIIESKQWYRFETRFEENTLNTLDLLDRFQIKATFFVLGWIADRQPQIVKEVARRGHEIASRGYFHRSIREMTPAEFRDDLKRAREALNQAADTEILGYRAAKRWSDPSDLWGLDILAEEGYSYDSSVVPNPLSGKSASARRFAYKHSHNEHSIWELPISTVRIGPLLLPVGGNFIRQFPHTLIKKAVEGLHRHEQSPFVMYFHVWELDQIQPRIEGASKLMKIRHYRNLQKMPWILEDYFTKYNFSSAADYLGLRNSTVSSASNGQQPYQLVSEAVAEESVNPQTKKDATASEKLPVTIVVPCFNEELVLPYLANTLKSVENSLSENYDLRFVFVDDGSSDKTFEGLQTLFGGLQKSDCVRHSKNQGPAAAILTGIANAQTEVVCSIDCDCTYDPHELAQMIPLLTTGVDLVTASPYHPEGQVRNVPKWRLSLSRGASILYRRVLHQKLHTYTSCFRVYRKSTVTGLSLANKGFLGVAEILGKLDLRGAKIVEYPTTLELRLFGRSKMKVARTIAGHLGLMTRLLRMRFINKLRAEQPILHDPTKKIKISQTDPLNHSGRIT